MDLHLSQDRHEGPQLCSQSPKPLIHQAHARVSSFLQLRWRAIMRILEATPLCLDHEHHTHSSEQYARTVITKTMCFISPFISATTEE